MIHRNFIAEARALLDSANGIIIFGAGQNGLKVARALEGTSMKLVFADDTASKIGGRLGDIPILSLSDACEFIGKQGIIIAAVYSPLVSYKKLIPDLECRSNLPVISFLHFCALFPKQLLPFYSFDIPENIASVGSKLDWLRRRLHDEESKKILDQQIQFRLSFDHNFLDEPYGMSYSFLQSQVNTSNLIFIDGGAFNGDTINAFIRDLGHDFVKIIAFEPDPLNYSLLSKSIDSLPARLQKRIEIRNQGLWSESRALSFCATGTPSSSIVNDNKGVTKVSMVSIDSIDFPEGEIFIKLDVEGVEIEVLKGMSNLIKQRHPIIGVSIYHEPSDLWEIPIIVDEMYPGCKLRLISHGHLGADLSLYIYPR